jgi:hypothetical protein
MGEVVSFNSGRQTSIAAEPLRWSAEIEYRTENGGEWRSVQFEELAELDQIIESGPHWDCLVRCVVTLNRPSERAGLTLEASMRL